MQKMCCNNDCDLYTLLYVERVPNNSVWYQKGLKLGYLFSNSIAIEYYMN